MDSSNSGNVERKPFVCTYCRSQQFDTMHQLYRHFVICPNSPYRGGSSTFPDPNLTWSRQTSRRPSPVSPPPPTASFDSIDHPSIQMAAFFGDSSALRESGSGQAFQSDDFPTDEASLQSFLNANAATGSFVQHHVDLTPRARDYSPFFHDVRTNFSYSNPIPYDPNVVFTHIDPASLSLPTSERSGSSGSSLDPAAAIASSRITFPNTRDGAQAISSATSNLSGEFIYSETSRSAPALNSEVEDPQLFTNAGSLNLRLTNSAPELSMPAVQAIERMSLEDQAQEENRSVKSSR